MAVTMTPFLYPLLRPLPPAVVRLAVASTPRPPRYQSYGTLLSEESRAEPPSPPLEVDSSNHLNPTPADYSRSMFTDRCTLTVHAGSGGHGCISFLREKYIAAGPANGGDGGSGGSIYIQAVRGETSLHKLSRRGIMKAGRGRNGRGKSKGGERGEDVLVTVPVGTVIREIARFDPVAVEEERLQLEAGQAGGDIEGDRRGRWRRDRWILYPSTLPSEYATAEFPALPRPRRSNLTLSQPAAPIQLDLSTPMERPMLLAAGAMGGLGNPHFVTKSIPRPKYATKGEGGIRLTLELELKLLADVGLVGLPNAGKSTLLRSLSRSRARVGDWAFTTLSPNVGTVVLDNHRGRPTRGGEGQEARTHFSIADIPGLIEDAHLDRGLGLGFLRHIERARVLAFVVDLSAGDAVTALQGLWQEVSAYEALRRADVEREERARVVQWKPLEAIRHDGGVPKLRPAIPSTPLPISSKPWFVVATKADRADTQGNFEKLVSYLTHPPRRKESWKGRIGAFPVSAIHGQGVEKIVDWTVGLLADG
ncbi:MAG: GTPase of the mitochondrial inner membrane that associates with the large ribosomal subunit [Thelocarpon superellum]|nr:MAG: GTPase of the mitochondrial inner membrane that associates with the large ribosomal subunit [Thelocarpon superellum]